MRLAGQHFKQYLKFMYQVAQGKRTIIIAPDYVVISKKHYDEMLSKLNSGEIIVKSASSIQTGDDVLSADGSPSEPNDQPSLSDAVRMIDEALSDLSDSEKAPGLSTQDFGEWQGLRHALSIVIQTLGNSQYEEYIKKWNLPNRIARI